MDRAVTVLPEPLSPTIPRMLCSSRLKLTPLTALTVPSVVLKWVWRSETSRIAFAIWPLVPFKLRACEQIPAQLSF